MVVVEDKKNKRVKNSAPMAVSAGDLLTAAENIGKIHALQTNPMPLENATKSNLMLGAITPPTSGIFLQN